MNDSQIKQWLGELLDGKDLLFRCLSCFDSRDIRRGLLSIPEELINQELAPVILSKTQPYLKDYSVSFSGNLIFLEASLSIKQLGPIKAFYMLEVVDLNCSKQGLQLHLRFREDIKSTGNPMQNMIFTAAKGLLSGSFLQKAIGNSGLTGIHVPGADLFIDTARLPLSSGFQTALSYLDLAYVRADNHLLLLRFSVKP